MKKILVTGGAGFMGSNMIHYLLNEDKDCEVLNFDKLTYAGNLANLEDVADNPRYAFVHGDIADEEDVEDVFKEFQPDIVLNYAAETHVDRSILKPQAFLSAQIVGTFTLLEAVKRHNVERMVQISTDEVYGSIDDGAFSETSPFQPNNPYSAFKAGADLLCRSYWVTYQTPVIVTHSCNNYGYYQYPDKLISRSITNVLEDKPIFINGSGEHIREWIFGYDHASAIYTIMKKGKLGESYNIGTQDEVSNIDVAKKIVELLGASEDVIQHVKDRPGNDLRYSTDSSKLRELGWKPSHTFDEGMKKSVQWFKDNEAWWHPLKQSAEHIGFFSKLYLDKK